MNPRFPDLVIGAYRMKRPRAQVDPRTRTGYRAQRPGSPSATDNESSDHDGTRDDPLPQIRLVTGQRSHSRGSRARKLYKEWLENAPPAFPFPNPEGWRMADRIDNQQFPVRVDPHVNINAEELGVSDLGSTQFPTSADCARFTHYSRGCHICTAIECLAWPRDTFRLAWSMYERIDVPRDVVQRWIRTQVRIDVECDGSGKPRGNIAIVLVDSDADVARRPRRYALVMHCLLFAASALAERWASTFGALLGLALAHLQVNFRILNDNQGMVNALQVEFLAHTFPSNSGDRAMDPNQAVTCTSRCMPFFEAVRHMWSEELYPYFQLPQVTHVPRAEVANADAYARGPCAHKGSKRSAVYRVKLEVCKLCLFFATSGHTTLWEIVPPPRTLGLFTRCIGFIPEFRPNQYRCMHDAIGMVLRDVILRRSMGEGITLAAVRATMKWFVLAIEEDYKYGIGVRSPAIGRLRNLLVLIQTTVEVVVVQGTISYVILQVGHFGDQNRCYRIFCFASPDRRLAHCECVCRCEMITADSACEEYEFDLVPTSPSAVECIWGVPSEAIPDVDMYHNRFPFPGSELFCIREALGIATGTELETDLVAVGPRRDGFGGPESSPMLYIVVRVWVHEAYVTMTRDMIPHVVAQEIFPVERHTTAGTRVFLVLMPLTYWQPAPNSWRYRPAYRRPCFPMRLPWGWISKEDPLHTLRNPPTSLARIEYPFGEFLIHNLVERSTFDWDAHY